MYFATMENLLYIFSSTLQGLYMRVLFIYKQNKQFWKVYALIVLWEYLRDNCLEATSREKEKGNVMDRSKSPLGGRKGDISSLKSNWERLGHQKMERYLWEPLTLQLNERLTWLPIMREKFFHNQLRKIFSGKSTWLPIRRKTPNVLRCYGRGKYLKYISLNWITL